MSRTLPLRANLEWLRKLSKDRLDELRASDPAAQLSDAQLAIAREFGFPSWRKLKAHVEDTRAKLDELVPPESVRSAASDKIAADDKDFVQLIEAIEAGEAERVAALVARRPALAAATAADGQTPLHLAARYNDPHIAAVLVAYGADLKAKFGASAHTPLSWAVTCNAPECGHALLKLGAEADLFCAAGLGSLEYVQKCFDEAGSLRAGVAHTGSSRFAADGTRLPSPPPTPSEQISDALATAARNGHADVVRFLLTKNPDMSFRAFLGATPLHWAYFSGSATVVELLLAAGADPAARDDALHCTPRAFGIAIASNWGFDFIVARLLAGDATLAHAVDTHTSPLHEAARGGHANVVRLLLERGADREARDSGGYTPREVALAAGKTDVAELLTAVA